MSHDTLAAAIIDLQTQLPTVVKSRTAEVKTEKRTYDYKYATLAEVSEAILPLLGKLGLAFIAKPTMDGDRFVLAYSLIHESGQREDGQYPLPSGGTPQAIGSAITYGRRYCLCAVTGVAASEEDDDAAAAEAEAKRQQPGTVQRRRRPQEGGDGERPAQTQRKPATAVAERQRPPLPGETADRGKPGTAKDGQVAAIWAHLGRLGFSGSDDDKASARAAVAEITGRELTGPARDGTSLKNLSYDEAGTTLRRFAGFKDEAALAAYLTELREKPGGAP